MKFSNQTLKQRFRELAVKDCANLQEFLDKYRKPERYKLRNGKDWGVDYSDRIDQSHQNDIERDGYTSISQYESNTGKAEYFFP